MRATFLVSLVACGSVSGPKPDTAPSIDASPSGSRCDPTRPFQAPTPLAVVNTQSRELWPRLSSDELELFFASDRPGGAGGLDLYHAKRARPEDDFDPPTRIAELSTNGAEAGPFLSADNLTLFFHPPLDIAVTRRPTRDAPFGPIELVAGVNSTNAMVDDAEPYLTENEQVMYFPSNRSGNYDLFCSERSVSETFGTSLLQNQAPAIKGTRSLTARRSLSRSPSDLRHLASRRRPW